MQRLCVFLHTSTRRINKHKPKIKGVEYPNTMFDEHNNYQLSDNKALLLVGINIFRTIRKFFRKNASQHISCE